MILQLCPGDGMGLDRVSPSDLIQLAVDVGPAPMQVGACLFLSRTPGLDAVAVERLVRARVLGVPRLRQRLVRSPLGCGRPVWVDDASFDVARHVGRVHCPEPADEQAVLDVAAAVVGDPLPRSRPLWRAVVVDGLTGGRLAVVVAVHHVLADGVGGLALLTGLVDGGAAAVPDRPAAPAPSRRELAADAWASRLRALWRLPGRGRAGARLVRGAVAELGARPPTRAVRCSLNRPTGPRRRVAVVRADLDRVLALAHSCGGTLNDAVLAAVTGALDELLASRGEHLDTLVVSVPVSARRSTTAGRLGNQVGVRPMALPTGATMRQRVATTATVSRARRVETPGASAVLFGPVFRLAAALHLFRWFIEHQRLVHTFVSNVRGPERPLAFGGATVDSVVPIAITPGNVSICFGVLSYAGTLTVSVVTDPDLVPDPAVLTASLETQLRAGEDRAGQGAAATSR